MQYTPVLLLLALGVTGAVEWNVTNTDGKTCLLFTAETVTAKLNIMTADNVTEEISFAINKALKVTGNCAGSLDKEPANMLEVSFFPDGELPPHATDGQPWILTLWFTNPDGNTAFKLADYTLVTAPLDKYNSTIQTFRKSPSAEIDVHAHCRSPSKEALEIWRIAVEKTFQGACRIAGEVSSSWRIYSCSTSGLSLASDQKDTPDSTINLKDTRLIAQAALDTSDFPADQAYEQCLLDRTSHIVPIVVGACLAGFVLGVLVASLFILFSA